jgi:hypothetical protein
MLILVVVLVSIGLVRIVREPEITVHRFLRRLWQAACWVSFAGLCRGIVISAEAAARRMSYQEWIAFMDRMSLVLPLTVLLAMVSLICWAVWRAVVAFGRSMKATP